MINYDTPDNQIPPDLRKRIEEASAPLVREVHEKLKTPVPGNPHGGFPGFGVIADHKQALNSLRRGIIDKWNADNPDHELADPTPLEAPISREEIKRKLEAKAKVPKAVLHIDQTHAAHIDEVLKGHPEEHHDGLRAFIRHELDDYGQRPGDYYWRRAEADEAIKRKGKDPHDLMHRYEHHRESNGD